MILNYEQIIKKNNERIIKRIDSSQVINILIYKFTCSINLWTDIHKIHL